MIVNIRRSGGFAGIEEELGVIDTDNLQERAAARLESSIAEITRLLNETEDYPPVGADMFRYDVEIIDENGERRQLVIVDEGNPESPPLKALYELLEAL